MLIELCQNVVKENVLEILSENARYESGIGTVLISWIGFALWAPVSFY